MMDVPGRTKGGMWWSMMDCPMTEMRGANDRTAGQCMGRVCEMEYERV